jgi:hypothetical protein
MPDRAKEKDILLSSLLIFPFLQWGLSQGNMVESGWRTRTIVGDKVGALFPGDHNMSRQEQKTGGGGQFEALLF